MSYVLQIDGTALLSDLLVSIIAFVPRLVGALIVLGIGWFIGVAVARVVSTIADKINLDRAVMSTPIGSVMGGTEKAISASFGKIAKWFVLAVAVLAAANVLEVALLSEWIATAVSYLPSLIAGLLVITIGFVIADFIGDTISRTQAATDVRYTGAFATGVRMFLYFTVVVIGLSTMGVDVSILNTFAQAFAWGLAAAIAIGAGIALGWGGKDYVASNIDSWMGAARSTSLGTDTDMPGEAAADGGHVGDVDTDVR